MNKVGAAYIIYCRVSTVGQGESGLGLAAQLRDCRKYVERTKGKVLKEFQEIQSGTNKKVRPVITEAVLLCKQTNAILLVSKLDRLGRSVSFLTTLRDSGVQIESCDHGRIASALIFSIMCGLAEEERNMISRRTIAGLAQAKKNPNITLGSPFGWSRVGGKSQAMQQKKAQEHHSKVVKIVADERELGKTWQYIADKINRYEFQTQSGKAYSVPLVRKIFRKYTSGIPPP